MQPNQNEYPIDYLNQIAPEQKKPGLGNKIFFIIIGIGVVLAAAIGVLTLLSGGTSSTEKLQTLSARMQTLQKISNTSEKSLKSSKLRSTNSTLTLFLTNANRDIKDPLLKSGIKPEVLDKKIVRQEDGSEMIKILEDARLNAIYDRMYAREMGFQLNTLASLMKEIYTVTKSKSLKEFLVTTDENMKPIRAQLTAFNSVTE